MAQDATGNIAVDQPTYQREGNPRLVSVDARAQASDFGGGEGLNAVAGGLDSVASTMDQVSAKRDALWAQNTATKAEVDWQQKMSDAKQAFELDPSKGFDYANQFKTQYNDYQQSILNDPNNANVSGRAKDMMMTRMNSMGSQLFGTALNLQAKASTDWSIQTTQSTVDNINKQTNSSAAWVGYKSDGSPDTSFFDGQRQKLTETLGASNGLIPRSMSHELLLSQNKEIDQSEIDTAANSHGDGQAAKWIADGHLGTSLSIPERQEQVLRLQRQEQEATTSNIRDFSDEAKNYSLEVQMTGSRDPVEEHKIWAMASTAYGTAGPAYAAEAARKFSTDVTYSEDQKQLDSLEQQYGNKYPTPQAKSDFLKMIQGPNHSITPEEANDAFYINNLPYIRQGMNPIDAMARVREQQSNFNQNVADATKVSQARALLPSMSIDQLQQAKVTLGDNPTDTVGKSVSPIIDARIKSIKEDTFAATAQGDKQMQSMAAQVNQLSQSDPAKAASVYQDMVKYSLPIQQRLNPGASPMVMMKQDADDFVSRYNTAKADSGTAVVSLMNGLKQKMGPFFNQALAQLHNNRDKPLPTGLNFVASADPDKALDIANAIAIPDGKGQGVKDKDGNEKLGYTKLFENDGHAPDEKEIDSLIQQDKTLAQYTDANIAADPDKGAEISRDSRDTISKVAKWKYLNQTTGAKDTQTAVDDAVKETIGDHAAFVSTNGVPFSISKEGKNGTLTDDEVTGIHSQLDKELSSIAKNQIGIYSSGNTVPDYTNKFNTPLSPQEEQQFQSWKQKYAPNDSGSDYDLRGAFKEGLTPDPERGHFPDTYKKPNHPTFSTESKYSTPENPGGTWGENDSYTPSTINMQMYGGKGLQDYFKRVEPNSQLNLPTAKEQDIQDNAYWVTKSDSSGVYLKINTTKGAITIPNSFRSFDDMKIKSDQQKSSETTLQKIGYGLHLLK